MHRISLAFTTVLAVLALAGCGGNDTSEAATDLTVTGTDSLTFEPDELAVPVGEEVTLTFTSGPSVEHDFVIEGVGMTATTGEEGHGDGEEHAMDDAHAMDDNDLHIAHAEAGQTVIATFTVNEPGTYLVYCSVPGHRQSGMEATLTVVDNA